MATSNRNATIKPLEDYTKAISSIEEMKVIKAEVVRNLCQLRSNAEGVAYDLIECEMKATLGDAIGRMTIVGFGITTFFFPPVGLAGTAIGYVMVFGSKFYQMKARSRNVDRLKAITTQVVRDVKQYNNARLRVFQEICSLGVFEIQDSGDLFLENLLNIQDSIIAAERRYDEDFSDIREFVNKIQKMYKKFSREVGSCTNLSASDFLQKMKGFFDQSSKLDMFF